MTIHTLRAGEKNTPMPLEKLPVSGVHEPGTSKNVVDDMGNVKFALDTGPDATSNSWLKYVRSAPSFEEQNLTACHLTGDQAVRAAAGVGDAGRGLRRRSLNPFGWR
ncbi:hypothetical protein INR49_022374 [Caranx melampygus]|nr:hypothetical protein INR49_022374 [Caranx melampygus]